MSCEKLAEQFISAYTLGPLGGAIHSKNKCDIMSLDL
jgi:predicted outer membrane repeat protein